MNKLDVLRATDFGKRIAEDEVDALESYFVQTEEWRRVFGGEIDVIYGPKGSGKSAIYSLLLNKAKELLEREILVLASENVRGAPVFQDLLAESPGSEEQLRGLWKLYFLSLLGTEFRSRCIKNEAAIRVVTALEEAGLISKDWNLRRILHSVLQYLRRFEVAGEIKLNPATGLPEGAGKITLREPDNEEHRKGFVSAGSLLELSDEALAQVPLKIWVALDRLDVAFADSADLEGKALRALFRVYRDMAGLKNISLKIFLRDDIWQQITETGFREASHITRHLRISWGSQSLLNLVIRRALHSPLLAEYYKVASNDVLADMPLQEELFYRIFPSQVDSGAGKLSTLSWILSRCTDGKKQTAPREVIHLVSSARNQQLKLIEVGNPEPPGETLIDRTALRAGLPEVSKIRFEQTLCAEHSGLKALLDQLDGQKTQQTARTLGKIWGVSEAKALAHAEKLAEVGFFDKRGTKEEPLFWVPFIYRDALKMIQGSAK